METIRINNTVLEFNKIIYVDANNGSDTAGDGSKYNPYQSLNQAHAVAVSGDCIVLKGVFYLGKGFAFKQDVDYIGYTKDTVLNGSNWIGYNNNIYRLIFDGNNYSDSYTFTGNNFNLYNIVYINQYSSESVREIFGNYTGEIRNSLFASGNWNNLYFGSCNIYAENNALGLNISTFDDVFSLYDVNFDSDYNITSDGWKNTGTGLNPDGTQAHIGVYGGKFAWGNWTKILLKSNNKYYTYQNNEFIEVEPTVENFEENSIILAQLTTPTDRVVIPMEGGEELEDGRLYRKIIDISKYKDIERIKVNRDE